MSLLQRLQIGLGRAYVLGTAVWGMRKVGAKLAKVTTAGGLRFMYMRVGQPRRGTIVWLHGFADHPVTFLATATALARDYEVIAPAMPGFAGPRPRDATYSLEAYVTWLHDFLCAMKLERVHLAGNSLGGATALGLALHDPQRFLSLTLVDNAGVHRDAVPSLVHEIIDGKIIFEVRTRQQYENFVERVYHHAPPLPGVAKTFLFDEMRKRASWYRKLIVDIQGDAEDVTEKNPRWLHHRLPQVTTPTQVIWGENDSFFPLPLGKYTAANIPGAELCVLPDTGHCPHAERPRAMAEKLATFAQKHGA